jgi:hypothetical protein
MKNLFNSSLSVAVLATLFLVSCAGISDANLSEIEADTRSEGTLNPADFNKLTVSAAEGEIIFRDGEDMSLIIIPPKTDDDR